MWAGVIIKLACVLVSVQVYHLERFHSFTLPYLPSVASYDPFDSNSLAHHVASRPSFR